MLNNIKKGAFIMAENNKENFATTPIRKFTFSIQFLGTGENKRPATTEEVVAIMREYEDKGIIKKWAVMNHNKDVYDEEEEQEGKGKKGEPKDDHVHGFGQLENARTPTDIGKWFDIPFNFIRKMKAYYFDDGVLYATHSTKTSMHKYQYDPKLVKANFDYIALKKKKETTYKREKNKDKAYQRQMEIVNDICSGKIKKYNQSKFITPEEEILYASSIDKAYKRYSRDYLINNPSRNMQCIHISGGSGNAKTLLAKSICESLDLSYKCLNGGSRDVFQDADGSTVYIINDFDFKAFGWKEFLNLTDNNTSSAVKSRYFDKVIDCEYLIFTSTKDPYEIVSKMDGAEEEEKLQAYRRFKTFYKMTDDTIKEYNFNLESKKYELVKEHYNLMRQIGIELYKRQEENKPLTINLDEVMNKTASNIKFLNLHKEMKKEEQKEETHINNKIKKIVIDDCIFAYVIDPVNDYNFVYSECIIPSKYNTSKQLKELKERFETEKSKKEEAERKEKEAAKKKAEEEEKRKNSLQGTDLLDFLNAMKEEAEQKNNADDLDFDNDFFYGTDSNDDFFNSSNGFDDITEDDW